MDQSFEVMRYAFKNLSLAEQNALVIQVVDHLVETRESITEENISKANEFAASNTELIGKLQALNVEVKQ